MKQLIDLLDEHPVTRSLEPDTRQLIAGCASIKVYRAESFIFRHAATASNFYLIRHGKVALELESPGRGTVRFLTLQDGDLLGASWLIPPYRWSYNARAIDLTRVIAFDAQCLRAKCEADPPVGYEMMKCFIPILIERLNTARLQSANVFGHSGEWRKADTGNT